MACVCVEVALNDPSAQKRDGGEEADQNKSLPVAHLGSVRDVPRGPKFLHFRAVLGN